MPCLRKKVYSQLLFDATKKKGVYFVEKPTENQVIIDL